MVSHHTFDHRNSTMLCICDLKCRNIRHHLWRWCSKFKELRLRSRFCMKSISLCTWQQCDFDPRRLSFPANTTSLGSRSFQNLRVLLVLSFLDTLSSLWPCKFWHLWALCGLSSLNALVSSNFSIHRLKLYPTWTKLLVIMIWNHTGDLDGVV